MKLPQWILILFRTYLLEISISADPDVYHRLYRNIFHLIRIFVLFIFNDNLITQKFISTCLHMQVLILIRVLLPNFRNKIFWMLFQTFINKYIHRYLCNLSRETYTILFSNLSNYIFTLVKWITTLINKFVFFDIQHRIQDIKIFLQVKYQ